MLIVFMLHKDNIGNNLVSFFLDSKRCKYLDCNIRWLHRNFGYFTIR